VLTGDTLEYSLGYQQAVFDPNAQKIALFPYPAWLTYTHQLLYYDGEKWEIVWEGPIDMAGHQGGFENAVAMYFDETRSKLMLLGSLWDGPESGRVGVFEFRPGHGFTCIADLDITLGMPYGPWGCYDTSRGVAVFGGESFGSGYWGATVEYDGNAFIIFWNPEGYRITNGKAAFDPETGKVVFFGENRPGYGFETMEWDGANWTIISTSIKPTGFINYMTYSPDFHGILAAMTICEHYSDCEPVHIWLYKGNEWRLLGIRNTPTPEYSSAFISYDPNRSKTILSGVPTSYLIQSTWELESAGHCRPVEKP
jgi:hypothetical protein